MPKQTQKQEQKISIRIGDLKPKRKRRRARRKPKPEEPIMPTRSLPPVVYQTLPQVSYYGQPNKEGALIATPERVSSIVQPLKAKTTILEDIGMVGTEGPVEILEKPTKRETLKELITPVDIPKMIVDPVEHGRPIEIPTQIIDPVEHGPPIDIPTQIIDPVETPAILREEKPTSIVETKPKRKYEKTGKFSKKPEPQRPVSPLTFEGSEGSFGVSPESVYTETKRLYVSPKTEKSQPTLFRSNTPEQEFMQKQVNKFFEPRKRPTSPRPSGKVVAL
jgi:hypothetical protein